MTQLQLKDLNVTTTALVIPPGTTEQEWANIAEKITHLGRGYHWWLGDLAAYAIHNFHNWQARIEEISSASGQGVKYIRVLADISKQYPIRDRKEGLSVSHHIVVAKLPTGKRKRLLNLALERKWGSPLLREHIKNRSDRTATIVITCPLKNANKLMKQIDLLKERYKFQYHISGKVRPSARKLRGSQRMLIAS